MQLYKELNAKHIDVECGRNSRSTYKIGVHAILGSFCAGLCSHIKTGIGRVTCEIGVQAIMDSFCAGFCSHTKTVFGADLLISSKTVT